MRSLTFAAVIASAALASAQTFQAQPPAIIDVVGQAELVGPITLTPDVPGDELLFRNRVWRHVVFVVVPHPAKSGVLGVYQTPGLCIESAQAFSEPDVALTIADVDGDGRDDVIGTSPNGVAQVLTGMGLTACRR